MITVLLWLGCAAARVVELSDFNRLIFPELACETQLDPFAPNLAAFVPLLESPPLIIESRLKLGTRDGYGRRLIVPDGGGAALNRYAFLAALSGLMTRFQPIGTLMAYAPDPGAILIDDGHWLTGSVIDELMARIALRHESDHALRAREYQTFGYAPMLGTLTLKEREEHDDPFAWDEYADRFSLDEFITYAEDLRIMTRYLDMLWGKLDPDLRLALSEYISHWLDTIDDLASKTLELFDRGFSHFEDIPAYDAGYLLTAPRPWFAIVFGDGDNVGRIMRPLPPGLAVRSEAEDTTDPVLQTHLQQQFEFIVRLALDIPKHTREMKDDLRRALKVGHKNRRGRFIDRADALAAMILDRARTPFDRR